MDKRKRELGPATPRMEAARRNHHKTVRERNKIIVAFGKHAGFEMHVCNVGDPGDKTVTDYETRWAVIGPKGAIDFHYNNTPSSYGPEYIGGIK